VYAYIRAEKARCSTFKIATACRVLGVSTSGYYDWQKRIRQPPCRRHADNVALVAEIEALHAEFSCYGSPRVHQELLARNRRVGRHRVARLMRANGIRARRGRVKSRPRAAPPARRPEIGDLVQRRFHAGAPNQLWCTDATQIRTSEGWLYAVVVLDAYSRRVLSWAVSNHVRVDTATEAISAALQDRRPRSELIVHSDRGYQFTSWEWLSRLEHAGVRPSIGRVGSALDNALIESWFSSFKSEALHPYPQPATRLEARRLLFNHINFHNHRRRHSALGYIPPATFEQRTTTKVSV
jgi:putative transposase